MAEFRASKYLPVDMYVFCDASVGYVVSRDETRLGGSALLNKVARIRLRSGVICGLILLLVLASIRAEGFFQIRQFSSLHENQCQQIPIWPRTKRAWLVCSRSRYGYFSKTASGSKKRIMARPNSPDMPLKRTKKFQSHAKLGALV